MFANFRERTFSWQVLRDVMASGWHVLYQNQGPTPLRTIKPNHDSSRELLPAHRSKTYVDARHA